MKIKEINDKSVWDRFIIKVAPFAFFQSWNWGEVERQNRHRVNRYGIYAKDRLLGIAQAIEVHAKRGDYLHIRHGPVFRRWGEPYLNVLMDFLKKEAKKQDLSFIRVSPLIKAHQGEPLQKLGFRNAPIHNMDAEVSYVIDLSKSLDKILIDMRKTTRNLIRRAVKMDNLNIVSGTNNKLTHDFQTLFKKTAKREKFVFERGMENEIDIFTKEKQAEIIIAYFKDKPAAGALIVYWGNQGIYRYAATSPIGRNIPASYLVQWQAIQNAKKRSLDYYNLWGGVVDLKDKSHPWYGLTLFKRGFGGEKREYIHALDLPLSYSYWKTYFLETAIRYIRGYDSILGFRAPTFFRELFKV